MQLNVRAFPMEVGSVKTDRKCTECQEVFGVGYLLTSRIFRRIAGSVRSVPASSPRLSRSVFVGLYLPV